MTEQTPEETPAPVDAGSALRNEIQSIRDGFTSELGNLRTEVGSLRNEWAASQSVKESADSAATATTAAEVASETAFDAQTAVEQLRTDFMGRLDEIAAQTATPVVVPDPAPAPAEEPVIDEPPATEGKKPAQPKKKSAWWG